MHINHLQKTGIDKTLAFFITQQRYKKKSLKKHTILFVLSFFICTFAAIFSNNFSCAVCTHDPKRCS